jgi:hypothetical protein
MHNSQIPPIGSANIILEDGSGTGAAPLHVAEPTEYEIIGATIDSFDPSCHFQNKGTSRTWSRAYKPHLVVQIAAQLVSEDDGDVLLKGEYVVIYRPSNLHAWVFQVVDVVSDTVTTDLILEEDLSMYDIVPEEGSTLSAVEAGDKLLVGIRFQTHDEVACKIPSPVRSSRITASTARVQWDNQFRAEYYRVRYKEEEGNDWSYLDVGDGNLYGTLTGLNTKTAYEWQVMGFCEYPETYSEYSEVMRFVTL